MSHYYTATDHFAILPAILLALFACVIFLCDFFLDDRSRRWQLGLILPGLGMTAWQLWRQGSAIGSGALKAFHGALTIDGFALFFNGLLLATAALVALISYRYLENEREHEGEYYGLILLALAGAYFLTTGTELITVFVGLETMSLAFYILVGFLRGSRRSNEAALKFFLLGAFSSGFMAYGFSILYGIAGSTFYSDIAPAVAARPAGDPLVIIAILTLGVGGLFKLGAAPFHMWAPDAYEGAPTPVTAFLSAGSRAASLAMLLRLFLGPLGSASASWSPLLAAAAVASLAIGNLAAVSQTNLKRLLAYSSVGHAGYLLLGLVAGNATGQQGIAIYIAAYVFMTVGAFLVLIAMGGDDVEDLQGFAARHPGFAVPMVIFLLSLAGLPPTAGFVGKYYIFLGLLEGGHYLLAVLGALFVAVALYYYFRIVRSMFTVNADRVEPAASPGLGLRVALGASGLLTLGAGIYPEPLLQLAARSLLR